MILKISWAADPSRSETVWFRSGMVPSGHIDYQKFDEFMFSKIITKKLVLTSNFSSVLFRHTRIRQTFDTGFHILGPPLKPQSLTGRDRRPTKSQITESLIIYIL